MDFCISCSRKLILGWSLSPNIGMSEPINILISSIFHKSVRACALKKLKNINCKFRLLKVIDGSGIRNPGFGLWKSNVEMGSIQVEWGFFHFFLSNFWYIWRFFKVEECRRCFETLENNQICQKRRKALIQLALKTLFWLIPVTSVQLTPNCQILQKPPVNLW